MGPYIGSSRAAGTGWQGKAGSSAGFCRERQATEAELCMVELESNISTQTDVPKRLIWRKAQSVTLTYLSKNAHKPMVKLQGQVTSVDSIPQYLLHHVPCNVSSSSIASPSLFTTGGLTPGLKDNYHITLPCTFPGPLLLSCMSTSSPYFKSFIISRSGPLAELL